MTINGPTAIANTYSPGIAAAIHRGDTDGAALLHHEALQQMRKLGMSRKDADQVIFWSMTAFATGMLRRVSRDEETPIHEVVSEIASRQHQALSDLIERQ